VLTDSMLGIGFDTLTFGVPAFINFTKPLLLSGGALLLPQRSVVIELREDVVVDDSVLDACRDLHRLGYALALDDYVAGSGAEALLPYAKFVKLDVLGSPTWKATARALVGRDRRIIAERVEQREMAIEAQRAGCSLFQGFYFCRPETLSARALPAQRQAYMNLFAALNRPDLTIASLEDLVKRDVSLTVRILRSINSAAYSLEQPVTTLRQALVLLGIQQVRQWGAVWAMAGLSAGSTPEVITTTLLRARMCEILGRDRGSEETAGQLFLLGMCSTLDVILDQPMERALASLPLSEGVRSALLGTPGEWRALLDIVIARERGYWGGLPDMLRTLGLSDELLSAAYLDAVRWAHQLSSQGAVA
jgi:EAL and modified HD-GYP domain-containing signal transduction protein